MDKMEEKVGLNFGSDIDNMTINELKFYYEVICNSLKRAVKELLRKRGVPTTDENVEELMGEYLLEAQNELGLEFADFDDIQMQ